MTLLAPAALFGLALLAIPILVHLFKPRHVRQTPFSSLRWLHLTQQRMARRIQWHQVLLFILRAAMLTLLVLALARPLWSPRGGTGSIDRILVLDVSQSMGRSVEGRATPLETARDIAGRLIRGTLPGDRTAILLTGSSTDVLAPWTTDAILYLPALGTLRPEASDTQLDSALEPIRSLLAQRRPGAQVEVVFLTDNPANGWNTSSIASFVQDVSNEPSTFSLQPPAFRLIDVGLPAPRNGWLAAARLRQSDAGAVLHVEASCVGETAMPRTLHVTGLVGVKEQNVPMGLEPGRLATLDLPLPASFSRPGSQVRLRLEPSDELPSDDDYYLDLDGTGATQMLLVEPNAPADETRRPGFPLRTAIRSLAESGAAAADGQLVVRSPATLTAADIATADVLLFADVPGLTEALATPLTERVRLGAGAAFFLGPSVQADVYNQRFVEPLHPAQGLLPGSLGGIVQAHSARGGLSPWTRWNEHHPLLAGLVDPVVGDLARTESRSWFRFSDQPAATDEILAVLEDGTPAFVARRIGAGRVVLFNASADDRWCDLPRRKSFVPLVDRLLTYLQSAGSRRQFTAGEQVALALPDTMNSADVSVHSPSGRKLAPRFENSAGRTLLYLNEAPEPGFYRVASQEKSAPISGDDAGDAEAAETKRRSTLTFVVQPGRGDSRLLPLDPDTLREWWAPAPLSVEKPSTAAAAAIVDDRWALEPWLVGLACLVFLAEMFLVHWLCPRINPAVSQSHVRRKGFVAPLREREGAAP